VKEVAAQLITRLAPTPSGFLHVGHLRAYVAAWLAARSVGGRVLLRIEDIDGPRVVEGSAEAIREDLAWLGLEWDEPEVRQSEREEIYVALLDDLAQLGLLSACRKSRQELAGIGVCVEGSGFEGIERLQTPYPIAWRPIEPLCDWRKERDAAIRFRVPKDKVGGEIVFVDLWQGRYRQNVLEAVGDFVLRRRDGLYSYQLACVADDIAQGVNLVIRGADLLDSTPRQLLLINALGAKAPIYGHVGLVVNTAGEKLAKRDQSAPIRLLKARGLTSNRLLGWAGASLGLEVDPEFATLDELIKVFTYAKKGGNPIEFTDME
jgi:glutamyl-tRNA synthetase